ncbi:MAG: thioredoxin domain-containing protein [Thermoanaerobaculia bacterium]
MTRTLRTLAALALGFALAAAPAPVNATEGPADRGEQILANLRQTFPGLAARNVVMGPIAPSPYPGLDQGSFTVDGVQVQNFFVSRDNTALYFLSEAIDVSRSASELAAEAARESAARTAELAAAIAGEPFRGGAAAPVTIVEFSDFQCPYCSRAAQTVHEILARYGDDVKFVFKNFPLDFHPWARPAAIAAECAAAQSGEAFWKLHDGYFGAQQQLTPENVLARSRDYLAGSGIDMAAWSTCAENSGSESYRAAASAVESDLRFGQQHGVTGTPGFFVNGTFVNGAQPIEAFVPLIEAARAAAKPAK